MISVNKQAPKVNWEDRRAEARLKSNGTVSLQLSEDFHVAFEARLMDISASGFRVRHANSELRSGHGKAAVTHWTGLRFQRTD